MGDKVVVVDNKVTAMDLKVEALDDKVAAMDDKVTAMDDKVAPMDDDVPIDALFVCLDVSGSIRGSMYPEWVTNDLKNLKLPAATAAGPAPPVRWVLWGSSSLDKETLDDVVEYLAGGDCLGGNDPIYFIEKFPATGVIDVHVYTDGEIEEYSVTDGREMLAAHHPDLKIRQCVVSYVNKNLDQMNVGVSAVFEGHVLQVHRTRIADGTKLMEFDAKPSAETVSAVDILDKHIGLDKTDEDMTLGMHHLALRFAISTPAARRDIRRLVKDRLDAVNEEYRLQRLTAEAEKDLLGAVDSGDWKAVKKPFIGHAVSDEVKRLQGYYQRFLNETK